MEKNIPCVISEKMFGVNEYWKKYWDENNPSDDQYKNAVGGLWDEIGELQFNFLLNQGLKKDSKLLDLGCGCFRGGIHFVRYLDDGNYYGLDINESLINAGIYELKGQKLMDKKPNILVNDEFKASLFNTKFDFILAQSVFTHLNLNLICRALKEVSLVMKEKSKFFCTIFESKKPFFLESIIHEPGNTLTFFDKDVFHYSIEEFKLLSPYFNLDVEYIGEWKHPRDQKMLCFTLMNE